MYATSRPTTPFIPPQPGASPAAAAPVIPPIPAGWAPPAAAQPPPAAAVPPGTPWPGYVMGTPYPGRGRSNSYHGMPPAGPPYDPATYFNHPAAAYAGPAPAPVYPTPAHAAAALGPDPWSQQQYLHPNYTSAQPTPVIPPRPAPSRSHSRSRSRGSNNGFSADWVGPRPGDPVVSPQQVPVPPEFAGFVPPGTPWYPPPVVPGTGYSNFQQPLPAHVGGGGGGGGYAPRPTSHHRRGSHSHPHSGFPTPWAGYGYLPPTPDVGGFPADMYDRGGGAAARPEFGSGMVDTRWFTGKDYGPVLDPLLAGAIKCAFKTNPLLSPPPDDLTKRPYLTWNMLFNSAYAHRSDEPAMQSWMKGRDAPATFPRLSAIRIISKTFPWFIDVKAHSRPRGVTCGDVIEALSQFLLERTSKEEYLSLSREDQNRVSMAYHHNRSMADDVPGGRLGEGLRRCDFLRENTMFGGLEVDQKYVTERMAIHGRAKRDANNVFVLNCEKRLPMRDEERRDQAARGRRATRVESASSSSSE